MFLSNGAPVQGYVDSLADRTPMLADANYYPQGSALELSGLWAAYSELYRRQVWVNVVVRKLAFATARLPFTTNRATGSGVVSVLDHPLAKLLARPNQRLDAFSLWLWTSSTYDVYGEAFWLKLRNRSGAVVELHPLHPTNLTVRRNDDDGSLSYYYSSGTRNTSLLPPIPEADVVPFTNYNPENLVRGLSNLEPLRQTLLNEDASRRATASWWQKGARPSIMLQHPKKLNDDVVRRLKSQAEARHGGADNTGSAMVLEEGMTAQVVQLTAEEMQYIESRKLNREEVCGAYDVPPPVVHILDKATFSNITEQMRSMYRDTMGARLPLFESVIAHHLVPDFDQTGELSAAFDLDGVLRGDFETRSAAIAPLVNAGVFKPSEARPLFGLPDAGPEADQLYANAALVPIGSAATRFAPGTAPAAPTAPALAAASLTHLQRPRVRKLLGALGTKDGPAARDHLITEHARAMRALFDKQRDEVAHALIRGGDGDLFDADAWVADTADALAPLTAATAKSAGGRVARLLGGSFDLSVLADALDANVGSAAKGITYATVGQVVSALKSGDPAAALKAVWADGADARAAQIAQTRVTTVGNFAETEAAKQNDARSKTWRTNSPNARPDHAALDGETVGLNEDFSNGMHYPGDPSADVGDLAGCDCSLDFGG